MNKDVFIFIYNEHVVANNEINKDFRRLPLKYICQMHL